MLDGENSTLVENGTLMSTQETQARFQGASLPLETSLNKFHGTRTVAAASVKRTLRTNCTELPGESVGLSLTFAQETLSVSKGSKKQSGQRVTL